MIQPRVTGSLSFCFLTAVLAAISGCTKPLDPSYVTSTDMTKQPASYQKRVRAFLEQYYGTPSRPRWYKADEKILADETKKPEDLKLVAVQDDEHMRIGAEVYRARCAGCHGTSGDGKGPAAESLIPKPRDYRLGVFKFTSTPIGAQPRRADLARIIKNGAKGTSMPSFKFMDQDDLNAVIDYVMSLSQRGQAEKRLVGLAEEFDDLDKQPEQLSATMVAQSVNAVAKLWQEAEGLVTLPPVPEPANDAESIKIGRGIFLGQECAKCHGKDGKGQQPSSLSADDQKNSLDAWGNLSLAADLTSGMLHGGRRPIDIYRRVYWGINGSKMPAFEAQFKADPVKVWHVVHYVIAVTQGEPVDGQTVAPAKPAAPVAPPAAPEKPSPEKEKPAGDKPADAEKPATVEKPAGDKPVDAEKPAAEIEKPAKEADKPTPEPDKAAAKEAKPEGSADAKPADKSPE